MPSPFGLNGFGKIEVIIGCNLTTVTPTGSDSGSAQSVSSALHCFAWMMCAPSDSGGPTYVVLCDKASVAPPANSPSMKNSTVPPSAVALIAKPTGEISQVSAGMVMTGAGLSKVNGSDVVPVGLHSPFSQS
jgi:hypothetical protein